MVRDLGFKPYIRKATPRDQAGVFAVMLKEEHKEKKQEIVDEITNDEDLDFEYWPSEEDREIREIIITGYPEEISEKVIKEYMAIYVHNPKATFLMLEDEDFLLQTFEIKPVMNGYNNWIFGHHQYKYAYIRFFIISSDLMLQFK